MRRRGKALVISNLVLLLVVFFFFWSDGAASTAVKGLTWLLRACTLHSAPPTLLGYTGRGGGQLRRRPTKYSSTSCLNPLNRLTDYHGDLNLVSVETLEKLRAGPRPRTAHHRSPGGDRGVGRGSAARCFLRGVRKSHRQRDQPFTCFKDNTCKTSRCRSSINDIFHIIIQYIL